MVTVTDSKSCLLCHSCPTIVIRIRKSSEQEVALLSLSTAKKGLTDYLVGLEKIR